MTSIVNFRLISQLDGVALAFSILIILPIGNNARNKRPIARIRKMYNVEKKNLRRASPIAVHIHDKCGKFGWI
jgi:hypothetical protein